MHKGNLVQNLDSPYLEAANAKRSKALVPEVQVYVEGHEDIAFWRTVFQSYEHIAHFRITQPSKTGKMEVLQLQAQAGKYLLLCVDSDFDYLLNGATASSKAILTNPHIFHTYAYSIENYQCYAESLHQICVQATLNDDISFDFVDIVERYSAIVYGLLPWVIYFQHTESPDKYSLSDCKAVIRFHQEVSNEEQARQELSAAQNRIEAELRRLQQEFSEDANKVQELQSSIEKQGYTPKTTYLFMQGHTLKMNIILMILRGVCEQSVTVKIASLRETASDKEKVRVVNEYQNRLKKVEDVLDMNTEYRQCFLYKKIQNDVEQYVASLPKTKTHD